MTYINRDLENGVSMRRTWNLTTEVKNQSIRLPISKYYTIIASVQWGVGKN